MSTEDERKKMQEFASKASDSQLVANRGFISIINSAYSKELYRINPVAATVGLQAKDAMGAMASTKEIVTGAKRIAQKAEAQGKAEALTILDKFKKNPYVDDISTQISVANPFQSVRTFNNFEKSKPASVKELELQASSEAEQKRINARIGTEEPSLDAKYVGYEDNFKDKEAMIDLLKSCIPCNFRNLQFSAEFGLPWENTLADLKAKWNALKKLLKDLFSFQAGEFGKDFCNIFKFLDGQCIPDILGMLSLLSLMQLKYSDLGFTGLSNMLNQLIAPFLSPIIGSFTSNLDQYADLILGPLRCIVKALENQIIDIGTQVNGVLDIASKNTAAYRQKEIDFIDMKGKLLRNRLRVIQAEVKNLDNNFNVTKDLKSIETRQDRLVQTKLANFQAIPKGSTTQISLQEEQKNIEDELKRIQNDKRDAIASMKASGPFANPVNLSGAKKFTAQSKFVLNNMEYAFESMIGDLTNAINDGIGIIKQSIDIYRDEFQRLILGRIDTQADQIEFTRSLQKFMRLTSIVKAVYDFKQAGSSLKRLCDRGPENALAQIAKQVKANDSQGMYDFYQATDSEGNPLMVITPGGSKVSVTGIDFDALGEDALIGDSLIDLDSIKTTVSYNDLNEVDKLNREGIVPSLGNIDSKLIELSNGYKPGSELDLHFKTSYAIISNEFCSKSAISYGSSDTVKQWAETLWQEK